jgi:hypothetical protein
MAWLYEKGFQVAPKELMGYDMNDIYGQKNAYLGNSLAKMYEAAPDNRYPAYAALMSDGRLVTDYRSKCEMNVPVGKQFATHQYMVNNAEAMIAESRKRQAMWNGALFGLAATQPPPADKQVCSADGCKVSATGAKHGLGLERQSEGVPALFGTFEVDPTLTEQLRDTRRVGLTMRFEGGRNSFRCAESPVVDSSQPPNRNA